MIAAGLGGRGASGHRGRSAFMDEQLRAAMMRLLELGGASCQSHDSLVDGQRLHFLEAGHGPPLLLLHGAGGGAANWYRLIGELSKTRRVLAPDLPGFGFSDAIHPQNPVSMHVARILAAWLSSLGVAAADVVGTSFGGLVALRLAAHIDTSRIIVTDTVGLSRLGWLLRIGTAPGVARLVVSPTRAGTRLLLRHALTSVSLPPVHEEALADYLYASARRADRRLLARAFTLFGGSGDQLSADELRPLRPRLRVLWGDRDRLVGRRDVERSLLLAGCEGVRIIPNAGHSPNWENPHAVLNEITEFLTN